MRESTLMAQPFDLDRLGLMGEAITVADDVQSPDGRWAACVSTESGRPEVYVTPFPKANGTWQVSSTGGNWPHWRRDGSEVFFLDAQSRSMAVQVKASGLSVNWMAALQR